MVKTVQFATKCNGERVLALKRQISPRTLSTPLPAKSRGNWWPLALLVLLKWPFYSTLQSYLQRVMIFDMTSLQGKGVLNVLGPRI